MANEAIKDKDYDLVSVIYNAARGAEICRQYMEDAQKDGDNDAAQYFKDVREQNQGIVQKGKQLLKSRL